MTAHAPFARRPADEQARLDAALVDLFDRRIRFNRTLGVTVESVAAAGPRLRFAMRPELIDRKSVV